MMMQMGNMMGSWGAASGFMFFIVWLNIILWTIMSVQGVIVLALLIRWLKKKV